MILEAVHAAIVDDGITTLKSAVQKAAAGPTLPRPPHQPRILVAEDNDVNRMVLAEMLKHSGYVIDYAQNGQIALDMLARETYDAILMDIAMPVMDGVEATKAIRADEQARDATPIPIYAITAHALPEHRTQFIEAGMSGYVAKPFKQDEILDALREALPVNEASAPSPCGS